MLVVTIWIDKNEKRIEIFDTMWEAKERIEDLAESVYKKEIGSFRGNMLEGSSNVLFNFEYAPVASISWW